MGFFSFSGLFSSVAVYALLFLMEKFFHVIVFGVGLKRNCIHIFYSSFEISLLGEIIYGILSVDEANEPINVLKIDRIIESNIKLWLFSF